jgi:VWFA-related protein
LHSHQILRTRISEVVIFLLLFAFILPLQLTSVGAQENKKTKPKDEGDVVRISSNLVNLDVIVKDKKGKAITDLKQEDFTIWENGAQQKIEFFDSTLTSTAETVQESTSISRSQPEPQPSIGPRMPRNIIALVLDGQSTELANLKYVREGVIKYVNDNITQRDSVALFSIAGGL